MKKLIALVFALCAVFALTACSDDGVPDDMQYVAGSDAEGFYFYSPEAWNISNVENIYSSYVSRTNNTSVTFMEVDPDTLAPATSCTNAECAGAALDAEDHYFLYHYFDDSKSDFPASLAASAGESVVFGAEEATADRAVKYEFSYTYSDVGYDKATDVLCGFIQYYLLHDGCYYVMTYSAIKEDNDGTTTSYYESYLDELEMITNNFRFVTKSGEVAADDGEYELDGDGYKLVSESKYSGFDFYAHPDYELDFASGIVSVTHSDGSNVTMSKATSTGIYFNTYLEKRRAELEAIGATDFKQISGPDEENPNGISANLGQVPKGETQTTYDCAFSYEYTYVFDGVTYHVYQILAVEGFLFFADGYVFTYTAAEGNYAEHLDEVYSMRDKVCFR